MSIRQSISEAITTAMKGGDKQRLEVLRMLKARMLEAEVAMRAKKGRDYELEDPEALAVIAAYAKQRRDSIDAFRQAGRADLAAQEEAELVIVTGYLPAPMSADDVRIIVKEAIAATGATSAKDLGAVMKIVMPKVKGAADGKMVNQIAAELLGVGSQSR